MLEIDMLVCILPHNVVGTTMPTIFAGAFARVLSIDDVPNDPAFGRYVLVQCGPDMYNHDLWVRSNFLRAATPDEVEAWSMPVTN
jgi:hypothetical protein